MKLKHMKSNHLQNAAIVRKTAIKDKEKKYMRNITMLTQKYHHFSLMCAILCKYYYYYSFHV